MSQINEKEKREETKRMEKARADFKKLIEEIQPFVKEKKTTKRIVSESWRNQEEIMHFSVDK